MTTPALPVRRKIDVESYHRLGEAGILHPDERVELVEGDIVARVPIGREHGGTTAAIHLRLARALDDAQAFVTATHPLRIERFNEPQPDLLILRPRADGYPAANPTPGDVLLVIEVAQSSLDDDRGFKSPLYARAHVPALWIVDLAGRAIEVHRGPSADGDGERTRHTRGDLRPQLVPDFAAVFA